MDKIEARLADLAKEFQESAMLEAAEELDNAAAAVEDALYAVDSELAD